MSAIPGLQTPNFRYFYQILEEDVNRSDKRHRYASWIAEAFRGIQQDTNWNCMRMVSYVTIAAQATSTALPGSFKCFTPEREPIYVQGDNSTLIPCVLKSFEDLANQNSYSSFLIVQPGSRRNEPVPVYKSNLAPEGQPFLNIFFQAAQTLTFRVSYFGFLPEFQSETDTNYIAKNYTEMVKARLKAIAFADINDPLAGDFLSLYMDLRTKAEENDARQNFMGRKLRMGG